MDTNLIKNLVDKIINLVGTYLKDQRQRKEQWKNDHHKPCFEAIYYKKSFNGYIDILFLVTNNSAYPVIINDVLIDRGGVYFPLHDNLSLSPKDYKEVFPITISAKSTSEATKVVTRSFKPLSNKDHKFKFEFKYKLDSISHKKYISYDLDKIKRINSDETMLEIISDLNMTKQ